MTVRELGDLAIPQTTLSEVMMEDLSIKRVVKNIHCVVSVTGLVDCHPILLFQNRP